jgi:hypothetical protein
LKTPVVSSIHIRYANHEGESALMKSLQPFRFPWLAIVLLTLVGPLLAQPPAPDLDAAQLKLALDKLQVLGSVLYVAAHPDDENTAALAYFSKGRKLRTAYLALTRGGGGQNLIGPELDDSLAAIRTQELLAARRVDGAEQYFGARKRCWGTWSGSSGSSGRTSS